MVHDLSPLPSGAPRTIEPRTLADHFEVLTRAVFNAGLAWQVVQAHWEALGAAFAGFDPREVAGYDEHDVQRIISDPDVIQSGNKIRGTVENAATFMELVADHNGFAGWLHSFATWEERQEALTRRFRWLGDFGAYWYGVTVGEDVPDYRQWAPAHGYDLPPALRE